MMFLIDLPVKKWIINFIDQFLLLKEIEKNVVKHNSFNSLFSFLYLLSSFSSEAQKIDIIGLK